MGSMNDHLDMLRQLRHSYANNEEEVENARRIAHLHEEIARLCQEDEQEITCIIRGMQEGVREAEADAAPPDPALHERKVSDLEAACGESLTRIASLENEIRYEQQEELRQRRRSAEDDNAATSRHIRQTNPKLRNELSLFANISRIAWRYGDSSVAGTVSDRQRSDLRPFSFDPVAMSDFEVANRLWEVVA